MAYSLVVLVPCIDGQVQGFESCGDGKGLNVVFYFKFSFSSLWKGWDPWGANGVVVSKHAACGNIGFKHTVVCSQFIFHMCLFFFYVLSFYFGFYLLELKDKKNKMGQ